MAIYISHQTIGVSVVNDRGRLPKVSAFDFSHIDRDSLDGGIPSFLDYPDIAAEKLRELLKKNRIRRKDASISIPTHDVIIRKAEIPVMSDDEFRAAAEIGGLWDAFSWMPSSPDEYFVDFLSFGHDHEQGMMTACMVAAPLDVVNRYTEIIRMAGLRTVMIDTHNFAIWRALNRWIQQSDETAEIAICEFVSDRDYVTVLKDGIPELTELYGMEQLRQQMVAGVEMPEEARAQLFGSYASQLSTVLQNPVQPESEEEKLPILLVLSDIPTIQQHHDELKQVMEAHGLQLGELDEIFSEPPVIADKLETEHNQAALLVTLGLGLRRIELFRSSHQILWGARVINLLPGYRQLRRVRKQRFLINFWSALIGIPLLAGMLWIYMLQSQQQLKLATEVVEFDRLNRSITHLNQTLSERGEALSRLNRLLKVASRIGNNYALSYTLLEHLVERVPLDVRLDQVSWDERGILSIEGVASSDDEILKMVDALRSDPLLQRVSLTLIAQEKAENSSSTAHVVQKERGFLLECEVAATAMKEVELGGH